MVSLRYGNAASIHFGGYHHGIVAHVFLLQHQTGGGDDSRIIGFFYQLGHSATALFSRLAGMVSHVSHGFLDKDFRAARALGADRPIVELPIWLQSDLADHWLRWLPGARHQVVSGPN